MCNIWSKTADFFSFSFLTLSVFIVSADRQSTPFQICFLLNNCSSSFNLFCLGDLYPDPPPPPHTHTKKILFQSSRLICVICLLVCVRLSIQWRCQQEHWDTQLFPPEKTRSVKDCRWSFHIISIVTFYSLTENTTDTASY